ncbi:MAG: hypothetical protein JST57_00280, partial [Bacteroidetes bacterium]|nr:hypothetical protein [Bacteroidota bacterium]
MKKSILLLFSLFCITLVFGQNNYTKPGSFAIHFILDDFPTAKEIRTNGIGET